MEESYHTATGKIHPADSKLPTQFVAALQVSHVSTSQWKVPDKAKSPRIWCMLNNKHFLALIDSGAEVNVLDREFARSLNLVIIQTNETALAANKLPRCVWTNSRSYYSHVLYFSRPN